MDSVSRAGKPEVADHEKDNNVVDMMEGGLSSENVRASLEGKLAEPQTISPIEALGDPDWEKKHRQVIRRLDMTFMPIMWILSFHNHLDRNNIALVCPAQTLAVSG